MKRTMILTATVAALALAGCGHKNKTKAADPAASEAAATSAATDGASASASGESADDAMTKKAH
ncbi:MAG: hypothetical protein ACKOPG_00820 [Novosphingobium sp.]